MKVYKIKSEDKAAFLNRMEKVKSPIDTTQIKDIPEEEAFEVTITDPEQLRLVKTILGQAPKINVLKEGISLLEIIEEAVADDVKKAAEANKVIDWVEEKVKNYVNDTKEIEFYNNPYNKIVLNFKPLDLEIVLTSLPGKVNANYFAKIKTIYVYDVNIKGEEVKSINIFNPKFKISATFDKKALFHEIIHHLDFIRQYKGGIKGFEKSAERIKRPDDTIDWEKYYNEPLEMNTHFFERVFPGILEDIKNNKELINKPFSDFFKETLKDYAFSTFYGYLNDKNKRKIQKRLGTLYLELKNNPDKIKELSKVDIDNIKYEKEKVGWLKKIWNKLSS